MNRFSTNEAAKRLGITATSLVRYIKSGKIPPPESVETGKASLHLWTEGQIELVRKLLPKIKNGRRTWRQKKQLAIGNKRLAKAKPKTKKKK